MPNKHEKEKENNIKACSVIRDNPSAKPVAVIQAVRAINKFEDTIRIMAMNTINTMLESANPVQSNLPTEDDVITKIRGSKK